jgi:hypothetical protein
MPMVDGDAVIKFRSLLRGTKAEIALQVASFKQGGADKASAIKEQAGKSKGLIETVVSALGVKP